MKKCLKVILIIFIGIVLSIVIDFICIFTINRPIFAIKVDNGDSVNIIYKGLFFDTYNCQEYSVPQIKVKNAKFTCAVLTFDTGDVVKIEDKTKEIKDFTCAEVLEQFYEDENYLYFYPCLKSDYVIVKYVSGYEETVSDALKYGTIKIKDLDLYNIKYYKENK